jgi:Ca2+-binding EF-hand superfamily protein
MCAGLAPDPASPEHRDLQAAYRKYWQELARFADADDDGAVSLEEFLAAIDRAMLAEPDFVEDNMLVVTRALFEAMDADGDGAVSLDEYTAMFRAIDLDDDLAKAGFEILDSNDDESISKDELVEGMRAVFYSSEPAQAPGSRVLR